MPKSPKTNFFTVATEFTYLQTDRQTLHKCRLMGQTPIDPLKDPNAVEKTRTINVIINAPVKAVTRMMLDAATRAMIQRLQTQFDVKPEHITNMALTSVSWLGLMSPDDFYARPEEGEAPSIN